MYPHSYAVEIEHILSKMVGCERGGYASTIDADSIESNWYGPVYFALGFLAAFDSEKADDVAEFIDRFSFYFRFDLRTLLSFETDSRSDGAIVYELAYANGKEAVEDIIANLRELSR